MASEKVANQGNSKALFHPDIDDAICTHPHFHMLGTQSIAFNTNKILPNISPYVKSRYIIACGKFYQDACLLCLGVP